MTKRWRRPMTAREGRRETRVIWTVAIVIVLLIGLALYGYLSGTWEQAPRVG